MQIKTYVAGPIDANNYLVWDENTKRAVLIDCSDYREDILQDVTDFGLKVEYILLTHGHFDHVLGVNAMSNALEAKVVINEKDNVLLQNINEFRNFFIGLPELEIPHTDIFVNDNDEISVGNMQIKILHTPGHTEGGVCYLIDSAFLFCGDTVFRGSYGRTDLFGGDFNKIKHSICDIIFKLDNNIKIYPGHGEISTIDYEKKYNDIKEVLG